MNWGGFGAAVLWPGCFLCGRGGHIKQGLHRGAVGMRDLVQDGWVVCYPWKQQEKIKGRKRRGGKKKEKMKKKKKEPGEF